MLEVNDKAVFIEDKQKRALGSFRESSNINREVFMNKDAKKGEKQKKTLKKQDKKLLKKINKKKIDRKKQIEKKKKNDKKKRAKNMN